MLRRERDIFDFGTAIGNPFVAQKKGQIRLRLRAFNYKL